MLLRIYCLLFGLILFLPTLQHSLNILPSTTLVGKEEPPPKVQWSMTGWLDVVDEGGASESNPRSRIHSCVFRKWEG